MSPANDDGVIDLKMRLERAERLLAQTHRELRVLATDEAIHPQTTRHALGVLAENERHYPTLSL